VHLQSLTNCADKLVTTEPKVAKTVYTFDNTFKNSERVKINSIWQRITHM